jgi:hypothetical protein
MLKILLVISILSTAPSAHAISCFDSIVQIFKKPEPKTDPLLSYAPGSQVQYQSKSEWLHGTVIDHNFEGIRLKNESGKEIFIKNKHQEQLKLVHDAKETRTVTYELWSLRKKLRVSQKADLWPEIRSSLHSEISELRNLPKKQREAYLEKTGKQIINDLKKKIGHDELGFHFNLHGGSIDDYVDQGGIKISQGDIALQYGHGDPNYKVYFFRSSNMSLYQLLNEGNPALYGHGRMGNVIMAFPYDSKYIKKGIEEGGIHHPTAISLDFDERWVAKQEMSQALQRQVGIPATEFIAPPASIFFNLKKNVGMGGLSRDEETLATMRFLERFWANFGK